MTQVSQSPSRRKFLASAGMTLSVPFLASLSSKRARAAEAKPPTRLIYYYVPNGINGSSRQSFWPTSQGTGANWSVSPMLKPLEAWRSRLLLIEGLENVPGVPIGGDHAVGTAAFITCVQAFKSDSAPRLGISADQIAASKIGKLTKIPSLQLGIEGGSTAGGCDSGYSCAYARSISWAGPTTPLPKLTNPQQVFDQLFAGFDAKATDAEQARRRAYQKSVLDAALADVNALATRLGRSDQRKLEEYTTGVRELERRVELLPKGSACDSGTRPPLPMDLPGRVRAMSDLMVLAFQCDLTRVVSFMLGNAASSHQYGFLGVSRGHHEVSHHGQNPTALAQLEKIGTWEIDQLAYLLSRLAAVKEGEGDLLSNTTIFWSSEVSDGDKHTHNDLPVVVAGQGGGAINAGRYLRFAPAQKANIASLLMATLKTVGVDSTIGNGTAALAGVNNT